MPYATNEELPNRVKTAIPSKKGKDLFRQVFNSQAEAGRSETVSFASAWAALSSAGYKKNENGKWVKKQAGRLLADWPEDPPRKTDDMFSLGKAEYQGREVNLNKPFRLPSGSSKKFGVYVKDGDSVKRVTFGDPDMEIRRDDPEARANFRARHNCDEKTDKTSPGWWSCKMWEAGSSVSELTKAEIEKRQLNDDIFTRREEAMARSYDLGMGGDIHTHQTADGQAVYMPGESHEAYLNGYTEEEEDKPGLLSTAIRTILETVMGRKEIKEPKVQTGQILKADDEQRIVWGWASVISENGQPVVDTQGDVIDADEMSKAADAFMMDARKAKAMHEGESVGEVIHSMPLTKELGDALGVTANREGWIIAVKVHDADVWEKVKSGEYQAFSIGGEAMREAIDG